MNTTLSEAVEECHDAAVAFNRTLYGWVMGKQEPDQTITEAHEK